MTACHITIGILLMSNYKLFCFKSSCLCVLYVIKLPEYNVFIDIRVLTWTSRIICICLILIVERVDETAALHVEYIL